MFKTPDLDWFSNDYEWNFTFIIIWFFTISNTFVNSNTYTLKAIHNKQYTKGTLYFKIL